MIAASIVSLEVFPALISNKAQEKCINGMGKKNRLMMGYLILLLSNSGYAMISYMPKSDWRYFYALSAAMRMMQGYADLIIYNSS